MVLLSAAFKLNLLARLHSSEKAVTSISNMFLFSAIISAYFVARTHKSFLLTLHTHTHTLSFFHMSLFSNFHVLKNLPFFSTFLYTYTMHDSPLFNCCSIISMFPLFRSWQGYFTQINCLNIFPDKKKKKKKHTQKTFLKFFRAIVAYFSSHLLLHFLV